MNILLSRGGPRVASLLSTPAPVTAPNLVNLVTCVTFITLTLAHSQPPTLTTAPAPDAPPTAIRFTTWNLENYLHTTAPPPPTSTSKPKPLRQQQKIVEILTQLRPDILGLCEMGSPADLAQLQANLKTAGLHLPHSEHLQAHDPERHLALLTRFPIATRQPVTHLTYQLDNSEFPIQRGLLDLTLTLTPTYTLHLIGAHLKARRDVPEADQALMRRNEAHLLRGHIDTILLADPTANLLVYGDFNDTRDQPSIIAIKGLRGSPALLTPLDAADATGQRWTYHYPAADTYARIDYLLASPGLLPDILPKSSFLYSGTDWAQASDHRPVTTLIRPTNDPPKKIRAKPKPKLKPPTPPRRP